MAITQITKFGDNAHDFLLHADARINIAEGSVRSGKTVASALKWLTYVRSAPPGEMLMVGKTERTLKRNVFDLISDWLPDEREFKVVQGSGEVWILGRRVYFAGANDERAEDKIRGLTLVGAYGDEITTWPGSFFRQLMLRLSLPGARFYGTTNPDSPKHWLHEDYLARESELDLKRFHFSLEDNPGLPAEYVANLKREYTGLMYRRFVKGEWCIAEGAVFDAWDDKYVVDIFPEMSELWVAIDYGTSNPTCFLLLGLGVDGRCYVLREYYHNGGKDGQKAPSEYSLEYRRWIGGVVVQGVYYDPSAEAFRMQLQADKVKRLRAADNDVKFGIEVVNSLIASDLLRVHSSCKNLLGEIASYVWDEKAQTKGLDKPLKQNDHAVDAMRYGIASRALLWKHKLRFVLDRRETEAEEVDEPLAVG